MSRKLIFDDHNNMKVESTGQINQSNTVKIDLNNPMMNLDSETLQNFLMFQNFMKMQSMMNSGVPSINNNTGNVSQTTNNISISKDIASINVNGVNPNSKQNSKFVIESTNQNTIENSNKSNISSHKVNDIGISKLNEILENNEKHYDKQTNFKANLISNSNHINDFNEKSVKNNFEPVLMINGNDVSHSNINPKNIIVNSYEEKNEISVNSNDNLSVISSNNYPKETKNKFDEIPIKPGGSTFLELLEKNLKNEGDGNYEGENNGKKKIIKHERFKKVIKVSTPDDKEKKKYKYYLQNFDKQFGTEGYVESPPVVVPLKEEKPKYFNPNSKSKSVSKIAPKAKKQQVDSENKDTFINKDKQLNINHKAVIKKPPEKKKENLSQKKNQVKKNENVNIWGENNGVNDDEYDDFLDLEKEAKQTINKIPINSSNNNIKSLTNNNNKIENNSSKLKESLNFNSKNVSEPKFMIGFNMPKEGSETKIELKSAQINQVKSKTLNQILNNNSNYYNTQQPKNPIYEQKLNNELNKMNIYNQRVDIKQVEDFKEEKEDEDHHQENKDIISDEEHNKSIKSEESDDRNIDELFKNEKKINNKIEPKRSSPESEKSIQEIPEKIIRKPKETTIASSTNTGLKPSIIKKNFNVNEAKKSIESNNDNENKESYTTTIENEKLKELNNQIQSLKIENEMVNKKKNEYEKLTVLLQQEINDFNDRKETETREFELYKENEKNKLLKEKKLFDKNLKALQSQQNAPNRKEREEIELLKQQLIKANEESKKKDTTNKLALDRLRKQLDEANYKIADLSKELKSLEESRLKSLDNKNNKSAKTNVTTAKSNQTMNSIQNNNSIQTNLNMNTNINSNSNSKFKDFYVEVVKDKNNNFEEKDSNENEQSSNEPKEISFEEKVDIFNENAKANILNIPKNVKSSIPQNSTKKQFELNSLMKNQTQVKTNNPEKLDSILNTIENKNNKFSSDQIISNNYNSNTDDLKYQNKITKASPKKNIIIPQKEEPVTTNKSGNKLSSIDREEEDKIDDITKYEMRFPEIYHGKAQRDSKLVKQEVSNDGKILKIYENNKKEVIFPSGMRKEIYPDGYTIVFFGNKDIKQSFPDGKTVYYFVESKTTQTTETDGTQIFKFENNQLEKHYSDGTKEINFPDGSLKLILCDGYEETFLPDGTLHKVDKNGITTIDYVNGSKDTIYPDGRKIKEFPDGRIKKTFPDGRVESSFKQI